MSKSLITGATGLLAHQQKLDVVATNIANLNTTGFKSQRVLFSDLIYTDRAPAVGASGDADGGVNPIQVGNGVRVAEVSQNFTQGVLNATSGEFDYALDGDGFFVINGNQQAYTRDGSFSVDSSGFLVDPATGGYVQRFGSNGEATATEPGFQIPGDTRIQIPLGASVLGKATSTAELIGNLPSSAVPPLAEVLTTSYPLTAAGAAALPTTLLNDLDFNNVAYILGDSIDIIGTNVDGSSFSANLPVGPATTVDDLINSINGSVIGATVTLDGTGNLLVTADATGDALLSVQLADNAGNTGETRFEDAIFVVETDGKAGDTVDSTLQIFDSRGEPHLLNVTFEKTGFNTWAANFSSSDPSVTLSDGLISEIRFKEDGSFQIMNGTGLGDANIEVQIASIVEPQEIEVSLDRLSHLATNYSATFQQDGFSPGTIVKMNVSADGVLSGIASNGREVNVAQLAIARFSNKQGLESLGDNYYGQTVNSGTPDIGLGAANGRGAVRGGHLESSNVDVALEFTQLIIAQRGFSANARSITVATEVLQELNNIF
ncbi:MAG: flagellar hook-basal body complex protein [Mariniblastus sp.]|nr:flagellar hook-basal body complex protein [Mariniblastus sp.]